MSKRTRRLTLTTLMATASVNLVACDRRTPEPLTWDDQYAQTADAGAAAGSDVAAMTYSDVNACKAADELPDAECDSAWAKAQADHLASGPRYNAKESCEAEYGAGNCEQRSSGGGGSFFMPFLAGMVIGNMFNGGRSYYGGTGYYRDRYGRFATPYGGRGALYRDPTSGRMQIGRSAFTPSPVARGGAAPAARAPATVDNNRAVSRGGFRSSRSYAGRSYGG